MVHRQNTITIHRSNSYFFKENVRICLASNQCSTGDHVLGRKKYHHLNHLNTLSLTLFLSLSLSPYLWTVQFCNNTLLLCSRQEPWGVLDYIQFTLILLWRVQDLFLSDKEEERRRRMSVEKSRVDEHAKDDHCAEFDKRMFLR